MRSASALRRSPRAGTRGFTIIEVLAVVAVLGILITLGVPSFRDLVLNARIRNAAADIHAGLVFARSEAIKRNAGVTVSPVGGTWVNGFRVLDSGGSVLHGQDAFTSLTIQCPAGTDCAATLTFRRDGRLAGSAVSLIVDMPSPPSPRRVPVRCVNLDPAGRANVTVDNNRDGNCANG